MAVLTPSLEQMCLQKVAIILCSNMQIKRNILEYKYGLRIESMYEKSGTRVCCMLARKTSTLRISDELRGKLISIIVFIQSEIDSWFSVLYNDFQLQFSIPFFWTPAGTIDRQLSATILIQNRDIEMNKQFMLTCLFCLDNDVEMWDNLGDYEKIKIIHDYSQLSMPANVTRTAIVFRMLILRKAVQLKLNLKSVLRLSGVARSLEAVKYAWKCVENSQEQYQVMNFFEYHNEINPRVCHFFLSMDREKYLHELTRKFPSKILFSAILWPLHPYFIQLAELAVPYLSESSFSDILNFIIDYCDENIVDYFICKEFWKLGHAGQKLYFLNAFSPQFRYLLYKNEKQTVPLILNDAPMEQKTRIILNRIACLNVIDKGQREALETMIKICFPSKTLLSDFKFAFLKRFLKIKKSRVFPLFVKNCFVSSLMDRLIEKCPENSEMSANISNYLLFGRSSL